MGELETCPPVKYPEFYCNNDKAKNHKVFIRLTFEVSCITFIVFWQSLPIYFNNALYRFQTTIQMI